MARMRNSSKLEFRTSPDEPRTRPGDDSPNPVTTYTSLRNVEYCTSLSGYANGGIAVTVLMKAAVFNGPVERAPGSACASLPPHEKPVPECRAPWRGREGTTYGERNQPAWLPLSRSRRPRHRTCTSTTTLSGGLQRPVPGHRRVPLLAALPSYLSAVAMPSRASFRGVSSAFPRVPGTVNPFAVPASVVDVSSPNGISTRWRASEYRQVPRAWARGALVESTVSSTAIEDTTPLRSDADGCHSVF